MNRWIAFNNKSDIPPKIKRNKSVPVGWCVGLCFLCVVIIFISWTIVVDESIHQNSTKTIPIQLPPVKKHVNHSNLKTAQHSQFKKIAKLVK